MRPIGLRGPKYSPFGPGRVDRVWTGLSAPAMEPMLKSVDGDGMEGEEDLEKKRREIREKVVGEPLSPAEIAHLVEKCQKNQTKRQINLGKLFIFYFGSVIAWCKFKFPIIRPQNIQFGSLPVRFI